MSTIARLQILMLLSACLFTACQLNEQAKQITGVEALPEAEHADLVKEMNDFSAKMNKTPLDGTITVERFMSGDTMPLANIFRSGQTCVLQYSELDCNVCVDSAVNQFRQFAGKVGEQHTVIIAASDNPRYMASFVQVNKLRTNNVYLMRIGDYQKLYKAAINKPFLYTVNERLLMSDCFLPFKEIPQCTDAYYASLSSKYFHHDN